MSLINLQAGKQICSSNIDGMLLCVGGNMNLLVNGFKYQFSRGSLCFIGPLSIVEILSQSEDCYWELISEDSDLMYPVASHVLDTVVKGMLFNNPCIKLDEEQIGDFLFYVDKIKKKQSMLACASEEKEFAMLRHNVILLEQTAIMEFVTIYFQSRTIVTQKPSRKEKIACDFFASLSKNFSMERSVEWYAKQAGLTPTYFSQVVHRCLGFTPIELIKTTTIAHAKMLLVEPHITIKEVSARLNFPDQLTFGKYFKNCTGMSPSEFRKMIWGR